MDFIEKFKNENSNKKQLDFLEVETDPEIQKEMEALRDAIG